MTLLKPFKPLLVLIALLATLASGCSTQEPVLQNPTTQATLWVQNAAEYEAITTQVYQMATLRLALAKEDSYWTASLEQEKDYSGLPPAIILDVDETILDNSAYQARLIKQNTGYSEQSWNKWVREAKADAIAGALEFTRLAAQKGITLFYLTNRSAEVEEATRDNLRRLGFPLSGDKDVILTKNEKENWTSAKTERREYLADRFRILLLFGDDLNDFVPAKDLTPRERSALVEKHNNKWGRKWFILPNPIYGSWEQALYNFNNSLSDSQIDSARKASLRTKQ